MLKKSLLLIAPAALLAGCTPVDYGYGESVRWNHAQQVENPDPEYAGEEREGGSGHRSAEAVKRYNEGQVKQPTTASSRSGGSGGSSGSSGSGTGPTGPQ